MTFPIFPYFYTKILNNLEQFPRKPPRFEGTKINSFNYPKDHSLVRAVNKFLRSRLIMNIIIGGFGTCTKGTSLLGPRHLGTF